MNRRLWPLPAFPLAFMVATVLIGGCSQRPASVASSTPSAPAPAWSALPALPDPPTRDPGVVLDRVARAYSSLKSARITSEADQVLDISTPGLVANHKTLSHQSTVIKYQSQPARLAKTTTDPLVGTRTYIADGQRFISYDAQQNVYVRQFFSGDLSALCTDFAKTYEATASPIQFLAGKRRPAELARCRFKGIRSIDGRVAYIIETDLPPSYANAPRLKRGMANICIRYSPEQSWFVRPLEPVRATVTLWVDRSSYLLLKSTAQIVWKGAIRRADGTVKAVESRVDSVERVTGIAAEPRFTDADFRFVVPPGAREQFVAR